MEETERFAAAAIAFAWQYDNSFRRQFWKTVCRFRGDPPLSPKAKVFVEPSRFADLLLVNPSGNRRYVYAVELKINAGLQSIQNPERREFGAAGGYGALLRASQGGKGTELRFVLCGWRRQLDLKKRQWRLPIKVEQRQWEHLAFNYPQTAMAKDLAVSLGALGIEAFPAAEVANMKVNTKLTELSNACAVLSEVRRRLGWHTGKSKMEFGTGQGSWWMGIKLLPDDTPKPKKLAKLLESAPGSVAWFGYEGDEGQRFGLSVWFYCGSKTKADKLARALRAGHRLWKIEDPWKEGHTFVLRVFTQKHSHKNDCNLFCEVFVAIGIRTEP
jgi:hypothetical protein